MLRTSIPLVVALLCITAGAVLFLPDLLGGGGERRDGPVAQVASTEVLGDFPTATPVVTPTPGAPAETQVAEATSTPEPSTATATEARPPQGSAPQGAAAGVGITRISIPSIGVDARVATRGVSAGGVMEDPRGPEEVAWYNFSSLPNGDGNIVMAGHVDYINYGAAVFYDLEDLQQGAEVLLQLANGETAVYRITSVVSYGAATAPVQEIVGWTSVETVTLITCGGSFDRSSRSYNERVIARAERV